MYCRRRRKKLLSGCLIGLGIGIILVLFLPLTAWFCLISFCLIVCGISCLFGK